MDINLNHKIISGLERLSEVFKTLLWEKAKVHGISPIQIQILLFVANHQPELCNVSHLAREFNLTKPTISDAVRVLHSKGLVEKDYSTSDSRSYTLFVSPKGTALIDELINYTEPLEKELKNIDPERLTSLFSTITDLIYKLNRNGIIRVQRTCFGCRFYQKKENSHYCNLLEQPLLDKEIRLDCPEYQEKSGTKTTTRS